MKKLDGEEEEEDDDDDFDIKVILVGETGTGKTSLISTSIGLEFKEKLDSTQSSSIFQKKMNINDKIYIINLWDTIGQEKFRSLTKLFMKGAKIVIFVYDITKLDTFKQLDFWFKSTKEVLGEKPIIAIVGNKSDLYYKEAIKEEEGEAYANKKGVPFKLTSAKIPKSFDELLEELVKKYIEKIERKRELSVVDALKLNEKKKKTEKKNKKNKGCC